MLFCSTFSWWMVKSYFTLWKFVWIAIVGDITPSDGISKAEKSQREREALDHMCKLLGGGSRGTLFTNSVCVRAHMHTCVVVNVMKMNLLFYKFWLPISKLQPWK